MLREHSSHAYDAKHAWLYLDAEFEFVASASWKQFVRTNGGFDGPSCHLQTTKVMAAESDNLIELRLWCQRQLLDGAEIAQIHRTWPIPENEAPKGHRLHGKRENAFLERLDTETPLKIAA